MKDKLESINMLSLLVQSMIGIKILFLPREVVLAAGNSSWISIIIGAFIVLSSALGLYWLCLKNPGLNITEIVIKLYGKYLSIPVMITASIYFISVVALSLRIFADSINMFLLDKTPMLFIISVMVLACLYAMKMGIKTISTVFDVFFPFIIVFIVILIVLPITEADLAALLPVFYEKPIEVMKGGLRSMDAFLGIAVIGYALPYFSNPTGVKKWILVSFGICLTIYLSILLMCIMVFGSKEIPHLLYPTITLSKAIQLRVQLFERAESIFMALWIPNTFTTLVAYYFFSVENIKVLFKKPNRDIFLYGHSILFIIGAMLPKNIIQTFRYLRLADDFIGKFLVFFLVPSLVVLQLIRERRKKSWSS